MLFYHSISGGNETKSGYVWYVQGIQPNVPALTTIIDVYGVRLMLTSSYRKDTEPVYHSFMYSLISLFFLNMGTDQEPSIHFSTSFHKYICTHIFGRFIIILFINPLSVFKTEIIYQIDCINSIGDP